MKYLSYMFVVIVVIFSMTPKYTNAQVSDEVLPDFFICNQWVDKNNDSLIDDDEYIGIKNSFNPDTDSLITFVSYFYDSKGKEIRLKLYKPDGSVYRDKTAEVEYEPTHVHRWWFTAKNLAAETTGIWTAKWYLDDLLQETKTFTINKPTTTNDLSDDDWDWFDDWWYDDEEEKDFFACNKWIDKDKDGVTERSEFIGMKNSFNVETDTLITFISYWNNKKDSVMKIEIVNPKYQVWQKNVVKIKTTPTYIHQSQFKVKTLASKGGYGTWTIKWYLNDKFVDLITVDIKEKKY